MVIWDSLIASSYDAEGNLTSRQLSGVGSTTLGVVLTYDTTGRRSTITRNSSVGGAQVVNTNYAYFSDSQLQEIKDSNTVAGVMEDFTFTYDSDQRLATATRNLLTTTYSYDYDGQLTGDGTSSYAYDDNGNRGRYDNDSLMH